MAKMLSFKPALTLRGREVRGLRGFAGKPLHPPLTDVPIGAYLIVAAFDVIAFVGRDAAWAGDLYRAARYVLLAGAAVSLLTALTGFADWLTTDKGTQVRREANAHAWTMITVTVVVLVELAIRYLGPERTSPSALVLVLSLAIALLLTVGAAIGGSLVYDFGFNVENSTDHPAYHPSDTDAMPGG